MLSFLREKEFEPVEKASNGQASNGAGEAENSQEQQYLDITVHHQNVRRNTIFLGVLFGIGLMCLLFMIKKSTPSAAMAASDEKEKQIEAAITNLIGGKLEMSSNMSEVVKKFYEFSDVRQVGLNELAKNPFEHEMFLDNLKSGSAIEDSQIDEDVLKQQLREQAKNLQLLSIMKSGFRRCCMINDKILYEGDLIKGFNVRQIGDNFVKLESEGIETILKLSK